MEDILVRDVPHGSVTEDVYWSSVMDRWVRQLVYTPPGYRQSTDTYPVVYLHQGRSESETGWVYSGKVPQIMDNLIADGRAVASIIVMNDGMYRTPEDEELRYDGFIEMICKDTIPYVQANYRCKEDKWNRALAGLSMGGMQASQGGLSHPELFAWLGLFSCSIRPRDTQLDFDQNHYLDILKDRERAQREYKLIYRANGIGELMRDIVILDDDAWLEKNGVVDLSCYRRSIIRESGGEHDWSTFRRAFRDFMQEAFR
jgi:enterochelin esterase-like enzyme